MSVAYSRAVALGGRVFVVGGRSLNTDTQAGGPQVGVYAFDPASNQWEEHEPIPQPIDQPNVAAAGDKLYVLGGTGVRTVLEYDPAARHWAEKGQRPGAEGIGAAAVAVAGTKIYLAGGEIPDLVNPRGARVRDFAAYDAATGSWEMLPAMIEESAYFGAAVIDGVLFTVGGSTEQREVARPGKTFAYDIASRAWAEKAPAILPVSSFAGADTGGRFYLIGGITGATGRINPETQVYDAKGDAWTTTTSMLTPRFAMGAAALDGKVYVPGGVKQVTESEFVAVTTVEVLGP
jgi:N-acetylneuraminic acid mutarotase